MQPGVYNRSSGKRRRKWAYDAYVPTIMGNTTNIPEPITVSYPEYGSGGIPQLKVDKVITFTEVVIIGD